MERDPVLLTVSKLDNSYPRGIDNMAMKPVELPVLDLPIRDFTRLSVEPADDQRSIASSIDSRNSGSRNFENIKVEWRNLTFKVKKGKEFKALVNDMSGIARPGTLTAIMGPSGAGKTTLLNLISGFYDTGYDGEVQVNGYVRDQQLFTKQSCYVMQEDRLLPALTVQEALTMSVELRMPTLDKHDKKDKVNQSIEDWGLHECRHTRTINLSGGQRRRLSIAQELVNNPPVVFLDEPTRYDNLILASFSLSWTRTNEHCSVVSDKYATHRPLSWLIKYVYIREVDEIQQFNNPPSKEYIVL